MVVIGKITLFMFFIICGMIGNYQSIFTDNDWSAKYYSFMALFCFTNLIIVCAIQERDEDRAQKEPYPIREEDL